jgi:hypothetical protein
MSCRDSTGGTVNITQTYDDGCGWSAIAYQFYTFLAAQGFPLDHESVGADVSSFVATTKNPEGEW